MRARTVSMPKDAAESTSAMRAMRLRSRPVIWRMGSTPACLRWMHSPRELAFRQADCISVTLTPWTFPLRSRASASCAAKSKPLGGAISAVTANAPPSNACLSKLMTSSPSN